MGLLDGIMPGAQVQPQGGLLGAYVPTGQTPAAGAPQMLPEMAQAIEHIKRADPQTQQQLVQQITQQIKTSGKPPELIQQVLHQFMQALQS